MDNFKTGDLVRCIQPESLRKLNVVGLIVYNEKSWKTVWIPDINKEIEFHDNQLEKINNP